MPIKRYVCHHTDCSGNKWSKTVKTFEEAQLEEALMGGKIEVIYLKGANDD